MSILLYFFIVRGGSFSFTSKHLPNIKTFGMIAVKVNPNIYQFIGKNIKDDDEIFKLAFEQNKEKLRYASERFRKKTLILGNNIHMVYVNEKSFQY